MSYIRCEVSEDRLILRFTVPKLSTEGEVQSVGDALDGFCKQAARSGKTIILDFSGLELASSAIIGKIVLFNKCVKERGVDMRMCGLTPAIQEIIEITRLDKIFAFCEVDDPDPFGLMRFEPDLFEVRVDVLEVLQEKGYEWMTHFQSVDLLHDRYGIEVAGIRDKDDVTAIQELLMQMYPRWKSG